MITIVVESLKEKVFLIKEWLDPSKHPFEKYLNNHLPASSLSDDATTEAHNITEFLLFAQHMQWQKTSYLVYMSDYQGAGNILTDPQITSDPCIMLYFSRQLTDIQPVTLAVYLGKATCHWHSITFTHSMSVTHTVAFLNLTSPLSPSPTWKQRVLE